jgi:hypothetical protein
VALASFNLRQNGSVAGSIIAPDDEPKARAKACEFFHVEPAHQFRVVVTKLEKVKERA